MPRKEKQKAKILTLLAIFQRYSDENHLLTVPDLIKHLAREEIPCERKSIYTDIDALRDAGYSIELTRGPGGGYYLETRTFELPELEILVDAVQNSRFITEKKSKILIKKLSGFTSTYNAAKLNRQVFIAGRVKNKNEHAYYNVDGIHRAIAENKMVQFTYWTHDLNKRKVARTPKTVYEVSPWALAYENSNYYLIAYQTYAQPYGIRHYRVDKMTKVTPLNTPRLGQREYRDFDLAAYTTQMFGMYHGKDAGVTLRCENAMMDAMIDRFGREITPILESGGTQFHFTVPVSVSPQFFSWVCGFAGKVQITAPADVTAEMKAFLAHLAEGYDG